MSISDTTETAILALIFNATAWANYADNAGSSPQTNIAMALHISDPGDSGNMSTSECSYTGYARAAVARTSSGWTISGSSPTQAALTNPLSFASATGGSETVTHCSTGKTGGGTATILISGTVTPNIGVTGGITPQLTSSTVVTLD